MALSVVDLPAPFEPSSATILPFGHLEGEPLQDEDHVVVDDLDVLQDEHGAPGWAGGGGGGRRRSGRARPALPGERYRPSHSGLRGMLGTPSPSRASRPSPGTA